MLSIIKYEFNKCNSNIGVEGLLSRLLLFALAANSAAAAQKAL
ncbi:hypothetical protein [Cesiribacter sp. SM1]|nr:hypothetical protein [Cesiribacter sp. SM1]